MGDVIDRDGSYWLRWVTVTGKYMATRSQRATGKYMATRSQRAQLGRHSLPEICWGLECRRHRGPYINGGQLVCLLYLGVHPEGGGGEQIILRSDQLLSFWRYLCSLWKNSKRGLASKRGLSIDLTPTTPYGPDLRPQPPQTGPLPWGGGGRHSGGGIISPLDLGGPLWKESAFFCFWILSFNIMFVRFI